MTSIASRLRYAVSQLRTRPIALSLMIPLMQEAADELERLLPPAPETDQQDHPAQTAGQPAPQAELVQAFRRTGLTRPEAVAAARGLASLQTAGQPAAPAEPGLLAQFLEEARKAGITALPIEWGAVQPAADALTDEQILTIAAQTLPCQARYSDDIDMDDIITFARAIRGTAPKAAEEQP